MEGRRKKEERKRKREKGREKEEERRMGGKLQVVLQCYREVVWGVSLSLGRLEGIRRASSLLLWAKGWG
jgi:hypothetical protein